MKANTDKKSQPKPTNAEKLAQAIKDGRTSICNRCGHRGPPGPCSLCGEKTVPCDKQGQIRNPKSEIRNESTNE